MNSSCQSIELWFRMLPMTNKQQAIELLGGTVSAAAKALGVEYQAVAKWPDTLTPRIEDRVIATLVRSNKRVPAWLKQKPPPTQSSKGNFATESVVS